MSKSGRDETARYIGRALASLARVLFFAALGAAAGLLLGLANAVTHAPADVPGDPLANGGFSIAMLTLMAFEGFGGACLGGYIGSMPSHQVDRAKVLGLGVGLAAVVTGLGWVMTQVLPTAPGRSGDGGALVLGMVLQALGAAGGMVLGSTARPPPPSRSRTNDPRPDDRPSSS